MSHQMYHIKYVTSYLKGEWNLCHIKNIRRWNLCQKWPIFSGSFVDNDITSNMSHQICHIKCIRRTLKHRGTKIKVGKEKTSTLLVVFASRPSLSHTHAHTHSHAHMSHQICHTKCVTLNVSHQICHTKCVTLYLKGERNSCTHREEKETKMEFVSHQKYKTYPCTQRNKN